MASTVIPKIFQPIKVGDVELAHRIVLAPMTRGRGDEAHVPTDLMIEYYKQRACVPGTLLITEAVFIAPQAGGIPLVPGIWSKEQIAGWKKASSATSITEAIHANGGHVFMQLWALGRAARGKLLKKENPEFVTVSSSAIPLKDHPEDVPHPLTKSEIKQYVQWYATAAKNAIEAGFDGVEVHAANGYLIDQFLEDVSNTRTDEYGGSIENRARFGLEVVDAVVEAIGESRTGIRFSPWSLYQDMRMDDPIPTFTYITEQLKDRHPNLAFIHVVSPTSLFQRGPEDPSTIDFIHNIWAPRPTITTGGYTRETAFKLAEETGQIIGFGSSFLANPDLVFRLRENLELNAPDPASMYLQYGDSEGYTSYPFSPEFLKTVETQP